MTTMQVFMILAFLFALYITSTAYLLKYWMYVMNIRMTKNQLTYSVKTNWIEVVPPQTSFKLCAVEEWKVICN